MRRGREGTR